MAAFAGTGGFFAFSVFDGALSVAASLATASDFPPAPAPDPPKLNMPPNGDVAFDGAGLEAALGAVFGAAALDAGFGAAALGAGFGAAALGAGFEAAALDAGFCTAFGAGLGGAALAGAGLGAALGGGLGAVFVPAGLAAAAFAGAGAAADFGCALVLDATGFAAGLGAAGFGAAGFGAAGARDVVGAAFGMNEDRLGRAGAAAAPEAGLALAALGLGLSLGLGFIPAGMMESTSLRKDSETGRLRKSGAGMPSPARMPRKLARPSSSPTSVSMGQPSWGVERAEGKGRGGMAVTGVQINLKRRGQSCKHYSVCFGAGIFCRGPGIASRGMH